jgi:hypothetical protein
MGTTPYQILSDNELSLSNDNIIVEIGSERGEGSTKYLHQWASKHNIDFYSIDVDESASKNEDLTGVKFQIVEAGHIWCRDILPNLNKKIKILYLDNFDWTDPANLIYPWLHELIELYAKRGVIMNNDNSKEEHRLQALYCVPHMDAQSIVIFDDTWPTHHTESGYDGKSGTAIPIFIDAGFKIIHGKDEFGRLRLFGQRGVINEQS